MRKAMLTFAVVLAVMAGAATAPSATSLVPVRIGPTFTSMGPLSFGPNGVLYAADRQAASIFALELGAGPAGTPGTKDIPAIDQKIAAMLGTAANEITITDLAVHPTTQNSYLSVMRGTGAAAQPALVRVDGAGKIDVVSMDTMKFTSITLPNPAAVSTTGRGGRMQSVTQMAYLNGNLYVTGLSNEEFASKFWSVPYPFQAANNGTSVEIWHGQHAAFETRSPIMAFVPTTIGNQPTLIAGYTCTPLVRFPVGDLKPGAKVMGTTIAELGAGNQPIDMMLYNKDGKQYLLMANTRHGVLKIATDGFATAPAIKEPVRTGTAGPAAVKIESMPGIVQLSLLNATHSIALQRTAATDPVNLQAFPLQ
jgi:hypothetical protein